jgi:hypothetical protein
MIRVYGMQTRHTDRLRRYRVGVAIVEHRSSGTNVDGNAQGQLFRLRFQKDAGEISLPPGHVVLVWETSAHRHGVARSSDGLHQFRSKVEQSYRRSLRDGILVHNDYELALAR